MASTRQRRVAELLIQEISEIIRRELKDPRVGFVTITDADVSPDLRHANVYFSVLGSGTEREETAAALNRAAGYIRSEFARRAQMRFVPDIKFHFDPSVERGARLSQLIQQARQDDEQKAGAAEASSSGDPESE